MPDQDGPAQPGAGDVVVDAQQIDALMAKQRAEARQAVEQEHTAEEPTAGTPAAPGEGDKADALPLRLKRTATMASPIRSRGERASEALEEQEKPRRGRPPKAKTSPEADATKRKGHPPKVDKDAPEQPAAGGPGSGSAVVDAPAEPAPPPRPVEEGKLFYQGNSIYSIYFQFPEIGKYVTLGRFNSRVLHSQNPVFPICKHIVPLPAV